jgi:hypothetical protein
MTTSLYPDVFEIQSFEDVKEILSEIVRLREHEDVSDFTNLNQRFVRGRARFQERTAPSSPTNVLSTDEEGDIVNDATYEYKLLNISGTLKWDRRTLDVAW